MGSDGPAGPPGKERKPSPSLLPIFRSQQQAELLALLLGDPELEISLTELSERTGVPYPSVHREVERAEAAGLVVSSRVGQSRLVRADTTSPYHEGLASVLVRAFGPPWVLSSALVGIAGITRALIYGSWAARHAGVADDRAVADLDVLVLGSPDRDELYAAISDAEDRLGRPIQITVRGDGWLVTGTGSFHSMVTANPVVEVPLGPGGRAGSTAG